MYAPLKVTTDYTLLKSLIKVEDLIQFLLKNNIKSCAICDENLYGAIDFYNKCIKNNIKPIIGLSVFISDLPVYLYARNYDGYKNMLKIHTIMHTRDITIPDLQQYKNNIVVILPYSSNELYNSLSFFENIYIGYENSFEKNNAKLINDDTVFVNELKAFNVDDLKYLEYLDKLRGVSSGNYAYNYYLTSNIVDNDEIEKFVALFDFAIPNNTSFIPKYNSTVDSFSFLYNLAHKGLSKRLNGKVEERYLKRLDYELDVIHKMGFVDYFLIVYDYVLYAKKNDIFVGPGRGSAAGSLVSFSIGIIDIDPLKYNLLFERFLNPERITMPDIDIDFDASKREEVINYVKNKYGNNCVAPGITFNSLKSKLVLREIGKILHIEPRLIDRFLKEIDGTKGLKDNLKIPNVEMFIKRYSELEKLYKISLKLEGIKKNVSTHAAGVVISSVPLDEVIPIYVNGDVMLTGVTMEYLEDLGLLKMDFLGVKNLTTVSNILKRVGKDKLKDISLEDEFVYKLFCSGKTEGIFQFETSAMRNLLLKLQPHSFNDLIAAVALGRPGPKDHAESFIKRKDGHEDITYLHHDLEPILKETYGIMLYQEQIIAILGKIGGYSFAEADVIRRAISKKKEDVILGKRKDFVSRAVSNGYSADLAAKIYDGISKFASYGFNKSHSVAYALISYWMAYLKTYYPAFFVIELLNSGGDKDKYYFAYLKQKGIKFFKPSVNNDSADYDIKNNNLIMPLTIIKNINTDLAKKIREMRGEKYTDYFDFIVKTKDFISKEMLETLIKAGTMDCFNLNQHTLIENIDAALNYAALVDVDSSLIKKPAIVECDEYSEEVLRANELASFGFYITNHPASKYIGGNYKKISDINNFLFKKITIVCVIDRIKSLKTKKGEDMAFMQGSDETGVGDFTVFPREFSSLSNIKVGDLVCVYGEVTKRFDKVQIVVSKINKITF